MKFVCEHCHSKYNIADSKVLGKVLKIRCKKCGNIIEVSDPSAAAAGSRSEPEKNASAKGKLEGRFAESFRSGEAARPRGTPGLRRAVERSAETMERDETELKVWFVALENKPIGPVQARTVHRHQKAGKVGDDTLVWKEGLPDWTALRNCKELVGLLAKLDIAASLEGDQEREKPPEPEAKPKLGLFADERPAEKPGGEIVSKPRPESPLRGQAVGRVDGWGDVPEAPPREEKGASAGADDFVPEAPPAEDSLAETAAGDFFGDFSDGMESEVAEIRTISPPRVLGGGERWVKIAAVGFLGLAITVLGVAVFTGESAEPKVVKEVVEKVVEVEKEKIVYRDRPGSGSVKIEDREKKERGDNRKKGAAKVASSKKSGSPGSQGSKEPSADEKKRKLLEQMGLLAPSGEHELVGGSGDKTSASGSGSGSGELTQRQIRNVVNKNRSSLQICYERSLKRGEAPEDSDIKAKIRFTVGGSGMVKKVAIGGSAARYPGLKSCMSRAVEKWVFPSSKGDSPVDFPTLFTPR